MSTSTLQTIKDAVRRVLPVPEEAITVDRDLKSLGADSIDRVEIITSIKRSLRIAAPLPMFATIPHIGALVEFCDEHAGTER